MKSIARGYQIRNLSHAHRRVGQPISSGMERELRTIIEELESQRSPMELTSAPESHNASSFDDLREKLISLEKGIKNRVSSLHSSETCTLTTE